MSTAQDKLMERERAIETLKPYVGGTFYTLTTYTRSQTDYVRVFVVDDGKIREITYHVARFTERRLNDQGIAMKGGGYSKALDVLDALHRRFSVPLDQQLWREL